MRHTSDPSSSLAARLSLAMLGIALVLPAPTHAADQTVLGSQLSVADPGAPEKRKVGVSAKEKGTDNTIVGDPVANGATLSIHLTGGSAAGQTFNLPSGSSGITGKPFWSGDAIKGYKYKDAKGENGAVASVQMSHKGDTFQIKVSISGKLGTVTVLPPNPGTDGCALLTINGGDSYSVNFATGKPSNKGATGFKIAKPTAQNSCIRTNPNNMPIDHIVVMMQENRSADTYFGQLSTSGQPGYEAEPMTGNPDPTNLFGPPITPFHKTNYCDVTDSDHSWKGTHNEVNNGAMDRFTIQNANPGLDPTGSRSMGYYDQGDLPFYYGIATTFGTGDRYFSSVQSQTFPNRLFLLAGTSFGHIRNDIFAEAPLNKPSIFNLLDQHGITWRIYASQGAYTQQQPTAYAPWFFKYVADQAATRVVPMSQYYTDVANGTLPNVSFIDPDMFGTPQTENDEHPIANVQVGQKFVADAINALLASPTWSTTALFLTWDEHGGFYDHVTPPAAPAPDATLPMWIAGDPHDLFDEYGIRVPVVVMSPYSKPNFVSHVVHDHTSILRFIETRFGLPALTNRDGSADPMLEFFDFNTATFATPPSLPAAVVDPVKLAACPG